ncbi:phosphoesterase [Desulfolithobacter sp.]
MEQVFCIARTDLERVFSGPLPAGVAAEPPLETVLSLPHHFLARDVAEQNSAYKQIIPYQVFRCGERFFAFRRGGGVGEQRLSGCCSLGIGGHLNHADAGHGSMEKDDYEQGLLRERDEELICQGTIHSRFIGWINDDSDSVGRVHLGAVHLCRVQNEGQVRLRPGGEDLQGLGWLRAGDIRAREDQFEPWSRLALELATR